MTMEEIDAYIKSHPERRFIVENLLNTFIDTSADTITLLELNYIQRTLPQIRPTQIQQYLNQKNEEKRDILLNNIDWFLNNEKRLLKNLHYAIERSALEFLYNGYRQVAIYYAKIGMIPDNIDAAEKQYRLLVNACIPEKALQRRLQEEADKFCKEINLARNFFSKQLGKENDFIKMEISIPLYSVNHTTPSVDLSSIEVARKEFINSKNMSTNMCSAANSVGLGIIGLIGKGIIDVNAVDDLIIREIAARKRYMKNVLVNLEKSILNQNASTRKKIESYVIENQKNFKIHANK